MGISHFIKEIGRGKHSARALSREQARDLFGQLLDGALSDLELGAFCIAMRVKGETPQEMAGFLDATQERVQPLAACDRPVMVLPSYNGARKLPLLTPLLALLLAREGLAVLVHGAASESSRVFTSEVLAALGIHPQTSASPLAGGRVSFLPTHLLCPGLQRLLDVRRVLGLRNPAHSLVKMLNPVRGPSLVVASYTHPQYARLMADTFTLTAANAMLLRATEGEPVADPRRMPQMDGFLAGRQLALQPAQSGPVEALGELPMGCETPATARYIRAVMAAELPVPAPIAQQVAHLLQMGAQL